MKKPHNSWATYKSAKCPCGLSDGTSLTAIGPLPHVKEFAGVARHELPRCHLFRCTSCRALLRLPRLEANQLEELYAGGSADAWAPSGDRSDWRLVISYLEKGNAPSLRVLDIGCGDGSLLAKMQSRHQRAGIEPNPISAQRASALADVEIFRSLADIPAGIEFDFITLVDVIEHFLNPFEILNQIIQLLAPGGKIVITTGNADHWTAKTFKNNWWYVSYPEHVTVISRTWLNTICPLAGLRVIECKEFNRASLSFPMRIAALIAGICNALAPGLMQSLLSYLLGPAPNGRLRSLGAGAGKDHLFIVLARQCDHPLP